MFTFSTEFRLVCVICLALMALPLCAEEKPQGGKNPEQDIWQEVTFQSGEHFELSDARIQAILEEIKRADPKKAESLETLRKQDAKKFLEVIRLEIGTAIKPKAESAQDAQPGHSEWQDQLQRRYEYFMDWFAREFPADHGELVKIQNTDAEKYVQRVMDTMTIYEPILRAQRYNAALADVMKQDIELQKRRDALLLQIRPAGNAEQAALLKELEALVSKRFDIIVRKKELQYESLRKRLEKLEQQIDQQALELESLKKNKSQTVELHIKELLGRTENITL